MTPAVAASDRLLNSLGSSLPPLCPAEWKLVDLLLGWRREIEAKPMPEWVAA
jgi:hypothetical protein